MKISAASLLFLLFEAPGISGFSNSYLTSLNDGSTDIVSFNADVVTGPASVMKEVPAELGSQEQPPSSVDYMASLSGQSFAPAKPASYTGFSSKPQAAVNNNLDGYLSELNNGATMATSSAAAPPPPAETTTAPSAPAQPVGDYMTALSGSKYAPVKSSSYTGFSAKPQAPVGSALSGYLGNLNSAAPAVVGKPAAETSAVAPVGDYMSSLSGGNKFAPAKPATYSGFSPKPMAPEGGGYLGYLKTNVAETSSEPAAPVAVASSNESSSSSAAPAADYMSALSGGTKYAPAKKASYAPFSNTKPVAPDSRSGYLSNLKTTTAAAVAAAPETTATGPADYMTALSGGNKYAPTKKASYAPFANSKPAAPEVGTGYLSNLKANAVAAAPVETAARSAEPTTASSSPSDYMSALSGGNKFAPTKMASYAPFANSKPKAPQGTGYLSNLKPMVASALDPKVAAPPAAATTAVAVEPDTASERGSADYMSALSGGNMNSPVKKASYAPFAGAKPVAVQGAGYLSDLKSNAIAETRAPAVATPTVADAVPETAAAGPADYMSALSGGNIFAPSKKASYAPFANSKPLAAQSTGYLGNLKSAVVPEAAPAPPVKQSSPAASTAGPAGYMSALSGGSATVKKGSYSPFGSKPMAPTGGGAPGGYLGNLNKDVAAAPYAASPAPAAVEPASAGDYMSALSGSKYSPAKKAAYAGFNPKPTAPEGGSLGGYLGNLKPMEIAASATSSEVAVAPIAAEPIASGDYMSSLSGSKFAPAQKGSYSGFSSKPRAPEGGGYLGNLNSNVASVVAVPDRAAATEQTPSAPSDYMSALSGGNKFAPAKKASYAPFSNSRPVASQGAGYLGSIQTASPVAAAPEVVTSPPPAAEATAGPADYMAALSGGKKYSPAKSASYAPFGNFKPVAPEEGYLGNLKSSSIASAAATIAEPSPEARESAPTQATSGPTDYMSALSGGKFAPAKKASYSPFGGSKPVAPEGSSYLSNMKPNAVPTPAAGAAAAAARVSLPAEPPAAGDYMKALSGNSFAPAKRASYSGFGTKHKAPAGNAVGGYLGQLNNRAAPAEVAAPVEAVESAPTVAAGDYLAALSGGQSAPAKKTSYTGFSSKPQAPEGGALGGYLGNLNGASPVARGQETTPVVEKRVESKPLMATQPAVQTTGDYMSSLSGSKYVPLKDSYSGFNAKPMAPAGGGALGGYLSNLNEVSTTQGDSLSVFGGGKFGAAKKATAAAVLGAGMFALIQRFLN